METPEAVRQQFDLTGRVAIVTGAGGGIGRTTAEVLSAAGASVVCADIDGPGAAETAAAIAGSGGRAAPHTVDMSEHNDVNDMVDLVMSEHGRLDVMCNIAGIMMDSTILELKPENFERILAVNLKGVLYGCQAAGRVMVEQRSGSIVNMASAAVLTPAPEIGPYAICKAGVVQLTKTMAYEVGRRGVRVNTVAPGFVPTNMTARYYTKPDGSVDEELKEAVLAPMAKFAPLRRVGTTADIAYCILYLASDASGFVTGQLISPNGGVAMP